MKKWGLLLLLILCSAWGVPAQELSCRVQVNSDKIQGTNKQVFNTLQQAITEYINTRKWSEAQIAANEKIDCSILIIVGFFGGAVTWWIALTSLINLFRRKFRPRHMLTINHIAGVIISLLGVYTILSTFIHVIPKG